MSEEDRIPTVQNLSEVQRKCRVRGGELDFISRVNNQQEQEPRGRGGRPLRQRRAGSITPLGKSHQGGGEGVVVDPTIISQVLRFQSPEV